MARLHAFRWRQVVSVVFLSAAFALSTGSCGDDSDTTGNSTDDQGQADDRPVDFEQVSRDQRCSPDNPPQCVSGKFTVERDGSYFWNDRSKRGELSESEFERLRDAVRDISEEDLDRELICEDAASIPELSRVSVSINPSGRDAVRVYEFSSRPGRRCTRGDEADATELNTVLRELMIEHAPSSDGGGDGGDGGGNGGNGGNGDSGDDYDPCANKSCGDRCQVCPPNDPDCVETAVIKYCDASGECRPDKPVCESSNFLESLGSR